MRTTYIYPMPNSLQAASDFPRHKSIFSLKKMPSILKSFSLAGKTVIMTGATGGIGAHVSFALAEAGADIVSVFAFTYDRTGGEAGVTT